MFKNCFALTKVMLKSLFDAGTVNNKKKKTKNPKNGSLIVASIILFVCLGIPLFVSGFLIGSTVKDYDSTIMPVILDNMLPVMMLVTLLLSMISIISVFFFSMDNTSLLPLPLKSWEILIARFISSLGFVYTMELMFVAPIILGLTLGFEFTLIQGIVCILILVALPFFPISICAIIFTLLSRIINFSKYKGAFTYISIFLAIGISLTISLGSRSLGSEINPDDISNILDLFKNWNSTFITIFPFLIPASKALVINNILFKILWTLLFVITNALFVGLFAIICQKPYYKTLRESDNNGGSKKKISKEEITSYKSSSSVFKSLVITEWKSIVRCPAFFANTIMMTLLMPIIMVVSFAVAFEGEGGKEGFGFQALIQEVSNQSLANPIALLVIVAIIMFICSMNMTSSSAISRMGKSAGFVKTIPVKGTTIIYSKLFIGTVLGSVVGLALTILFCVLGIINIFDGVLLFILVCSLNLLDNNIGLIFDLKKPVLNWDNENMAVKQNLNTLWSMLLSFAVIIVACAISLLGLLLPYGGYIAYGLILVLSILGNYLFHRHYLKPSKVLFKSI